MGETRCERTLALTLSLTLTLPLTLTPDPDPGTLTPTPTPNPNQVLRVELDREAMSDKSLSMEDITERIAQEYGTGELHVICNDDNADKLVLRVRIVNDGPAQKADGPDGEDEDV
jgi:hypothetical protein